MGKHLIGLHTLLYLRIEALRDFTWLFFYNCYQQPCILNMRHGFFINNFARAIVITVQGIVVEVAGEHPCSHCG